MGPLMLIGAAAALCVAHAFEPELEDQNDRAAYRRIVTEATPAAEAVEAAPRAPMTEVDVRKLASAATFAPSEGATLRGSFRWSSTEQGSAAAVGALHEPNPQLRVMRDERLMKSLQISYDGVEFAPAKLRLFSLAIAVVMGLFLCALAYLAL